MSFTKVVIQFYIHNDFENEITDWSAGEMDELQKSVERFVGGNYMFEDAIDDNRLYLHAKPSCMESIRSRMNHFTNITPSTWDYTVHMYMEVVEFDLSGSE